MVKFLQKVKWLQQILRIGYICWGGETGSCYYNNFNLKFNMYKYTDKSYFKKAFNTKHDIQLNTNKAYTSIKMT